MEGEALKAVEEEGGEAREEGGARGPLPAHPEHEAAGGGGGVGRGGSARRQKIRLVAMRRQRQFR